MNWKEREQDDIEASKPVIEQYQARMRARSPEERAKDSARWIALERELGYGSPPGGER